MTKTSYRITEISEKHNEERMFGEFNAQKIHRSTRSRPFLSRLHSSDSESFVISIVSAQRDSGGLAHP